MMRSLAVVAIGAAAVLAAGIGVASAQTLPTTVDGLVGAAKNAAGLGWSGTFLRLCIPPPPAAPGPAAATGARGGAPRPPARETWYAEPSKGADNLYCFGPSVHRAWPMCGDGGTICPEPSDAYA